MREPPSSRHGNRIRVTAAEFGVTALGKACWERDESQITGSLERYARELEPGTLGTTGPLVASAQGHDMCNLIIEGHTYGQVRNRGDGGHTRKEPGNGVC